MEIDRWIGPYKIRVFPWIDGNLIFVNVLYYSPGQSIDKPPAWDKTVYVKDTDKGRQAVYEFTDSLINHIANMIIPPNGKVILKFKED